LIKIPIDVSVTRDLWFCRK